MLSLAGPGTAAGAVELLPKSRRGELGLHPTGAPPAASPPQTGVFPGPGFPKRCWATRWELPCVDLHGSFSQGCRGWGRGPGEVMMLSPRHPEGSSYHGGTGMGRGLWDSGVSPCLEEGERGKEGHAPACVTLPALSPSGECPTRSASGGELGQGDEKRSWSCSDGSNMYFTNKGLCCEWSASSRRSVKARI